MTKRTSSAVGVLAVAVAAVAFLSVPAGAATIYWDGSTDATWDQGDNWSGGNEPGIGDDVTFPTPVPGTGGTITLTAGELANSLTFNDTYTLAAGGSLYLGSYGVTDAGKISVATGKIATISSPLYGNGVTQGVSGVTKAGTGTLVLGGEGPTFIGGITVSEGKLDTGSIGNSLGNNRITLDSGTTLSWTRDSVAHYSREVDGAGTIFAAGNSDMVWNVQSLENATWSGGATSGRFSANKYGPATWTVTGTLTVSRGLKTGSFVQGGEYVIAGKILS